MNKNLKKHEKWEKESGISLVQTIDQDKLNDYVERNALKFTINLEIEEAEEIIYAELDYMEYAGLTEEEISIYNN